MRTSRKVRLFYAFLVQINIKSSPKSLFDNENVTKAEIQSLHVVEFQVVPPSKKQENSLLSLPAHALPYASHPIPRDSDAVMKFRRQFRPIARIFWLKFRLQIQFNSTFERKMGPWPGIEPGLAGPQPTVLTATPSQPSVISLHRQAVFISFRQIFWLLTPFHSRYITIEHHLCDA